ncbi:MAG: hypothetical protein LBB82_06875, partial [Treponema sp.]|nr:hypothetical protein [Treponema sp.]
FTILVKTFFKRRGISFKLIRGNITHKPLPYSLYHPSRALSSFSLVPLYCRYSVSVAFRRSYPVAGVFFKMDELYAVTRSGR